MSNHVMALEIVAQKTTESLNSVNELMNRISTNLHQSYPEIILLNINHHLCIWVYGANEYALLKTVEKYQAGFKRTDFLLENDAIQHLDNIIENKVWADVTINAKYDSIISALDKYSANAKSTTGLNPVFLSAIAKLEQHPLIKGRANSFKNFPDKGRSPDRHQFISIPFQDLFYRFCIN